MIDFYNTYVQRIDKVLNYFSWESVHQLSLSLLKAWETGNAVYLCGNGGSAGNPSITKYNDTNTGILFPTTDTIAITTAGTERLRAE